MIGYFAKYNKQVIVTIKVNLEIAILCNTDRGGNFYNLGVL